jgi:hypothetical protein
MNIRFCSFFLAMSLAMLLGTTHGSEIAAKCSPFLIIVEGDAGRGSASVIMFRGNPLIVTNAHVLSGNSTTRFRLLSSQELKPDLFGVAEDRDIVVATQTGSTEGIPASEAVDKDVAIGDDVVVLGNSQGSSVVTEIAGKVTGIGPDLIEVDAKFVQGNSGSPIIHVKSGKVIGVATFVTIRELDAITSDSRFTEVRRFGYRIDTVAKWQFSAPAQFAKESTYIRRLQQHTNDLLTLAQDLSLDGKVDPKLHAGRNNWVSAYVPILGRGWPTEKTGGGLAQIKYSKASKEFAAHINSDLQGVNSSAFNSFHREAFGRELVLREKLEKFFSGFSWDSVRYR